MQEIKLTLWQRTSKKADGTEFTSFSASSKDLTGVDSWVNGYRRTANTKDGPVEVIDLVIKPKQQKTGPMTQAEAGQFMGMNDKREPVQDIPLDQIPF